MANKRHKPEEIVTKLRQVDVLVGQGMLRVPDQSGGAGQYVLSGFTGVIETKSKTCSNRWAAADKARSLRGRPTICRPMGDP